MLSLNEVNNKDSETVKPTWKDKYKFPAGAILLIFFQWLSGMGAYCYILAMPIYMASILGFSDTQSTVIYHAKSGVSYFLNIFGAVIADSLLGRVKTYLIFQPIDIAIMIGIMIISIYSNSVGIIVLYFLLAIVGGCMGPALRTFIADQIPSNNPIMLSTYLHIIYLVNNFGVIIIAFVAPILHKDIYCFSMECYPLVFTVSFILTFSSFCLFLFGYCCKAFVANAPTNNLFINIFRCVHLSIKRRIKLGKPTNGKSFIDYAEGDFDASFIRDVKIAKGLCVFLLAHPLFWTVFEQLSSIWTLQAQYMDGMISDSYVVKPDQMQTLNPALVVLLIPIFEIVVYPLLNRIHFQVPYRIMAGQMFTALACVSMIFIQLKIDSSLESPVVGNKIQLNIANFCGRNLTVAFENRQIHLIQSGLATTTFDKKSNVSFQSSTSFVNKTFSHERNILSLVIVKNITNDFEILVSGVDVQKNGGYTFVRAINLVQGSSETDVLLKAKMGINKECKLKSRYRMFGEYVKCSVGVFDVFLIIAGRETKHGSVTLYPAESKTLIVDEQNGSKHVIYMQELLLRLPNIFWQVIPYILVTIGEVLFNVNTGIFLYGEAPMSMKCILLAGQYVCIAIGNVLILLLRQLLKDFSQKYLFLICGVLVAISGVLTGILGYLYLQSKKRMEAEVHTDMTDL